MKMEQTECSKTLAYKIQMPGNYPESVQHSEHGESLKSRIVLHVFIGYWYLCQFSSFLLLFYHTLYWFYFMVQVLSDSNMLLLYDNVPCTSFSNKLGVLVTSIMFTCGRGMPLTTHPPSTEVNGRVELYLFSLSGPSWPDLGWSLPLPLPCLHRPTCLSYLMVCTLDTLHIAFRTEGHGWQRLLRAAASCHVLAMSQNITVLSFHSSCLILTSYNIVYVRV